MGRVTSFSDLVALCLGHANRFSKKLKSITTSSSSSSPVKTSKSLATIVSNKAMKLVQKKKANQTHEVDDGFGDGGVWQRSILMGDKCQPLDFSGVIYYDGNGKQLSEVPLRSPRASPLPAYLLRTGRETV